MERLVLLIASLWDGRTKYSECIVHLALKGVETVSFSVGVMGSCVCIILLTTPTAIHRRPMCFAPGEKSQGEEMSATFLDVRGRLCALLIVLAGVGEPGEPDKKKEQEAGVLWPWTSSDMVLEDTFFREFGMLQVCVFTDFDTLLWIWAILGARRAAGGAPRREMT